MNSVPSTACFAVLLVSSFWIHKVASFQHKEAGCLETARPSCVGVGTDGRTPEVKDGSQRDAAEAAPTTLTLTPRLFASGSNFKENAGFPGVLTAFCSSLFHKGITRRKRDGGRDGGVGGLPARRSEAGGRVDDNEQTASVA